LTPIGDNKKPQRFSDLPDWVDHVSVDDDTYAHRARSRRGFQTLHIRFTRFSYQSSPATLIRLPGSHSNSEQQHGFSPDRIVGWGEPRRPAQGKLDCRAAALAVRPRLAQAG
jgi:hypothetical protein